MLGRARSRRNDPKDFVCFCQGISRQEIVAAIDKGAATLEDIQNDLGATVGPCGGSCTPNVVKLLADTLARKAGVPAAPCPPEPGPAAVSCAPAEPCAPAAPCPPAEPCSPAEPCAASGDASKVNEEPK